MNSSKQLVFVDITNTNANVEDEPTSIQGTFERFHAEGIQMETNGSIRVNQSGDGNMVLDVYGHVLADKIRARSDERLKTNIRPIVSALDVIKQLMGKEYHMSTTNPNNTEGSRNSYGLLAQEVLPVIPDIVYTDDEGFLNISYLELIPVLIEAVKELDTKVDKILDALA